MKKLILAALSLFIAPSVWAAAPTIVQSKSGFANTATTISVSFTSAVTAGNMILAWVGTAHSPTVNTPTMAGETFVKVTGASNAGTAGKGQVALYAVNSAAGGQTQVTATISAANDLHLHIIEINGQAASPQDATGNTESTTLSVSTSGATTTANDLDIAFFFDDANNRTLSAGTGYAQVQQTNNTTGGDAGFSESKTVSATGVQTATASGNSTDTCEQGIIAIAGTGGAAAPTGTNKRQKLEQIDPL